MTPIYETPWPKPPVEQCYWYHTAQFPDGETIQGTWTIPDFADYVGGYDLRGKTVLDIGTASGFLGFAAEKAGATVTALDAATTREFRHVPFAASASYQDIVGSRETLTKYNLTPTKNSWWYSWHKLSSKVKCVYAPIPDLYEWDTQFDVVMAGAIIEHLSDPVYSIGAWARVAKEAVIIPFTDVFETDDLLMRPMTPWNDPAFYYAWWQLSRGLYVRLFDILGFDVEFVTSHAKHNAAEIGQQDAQRPTIIARRRKS
jgi:SAM-dependent methyltransferase